MQVKQFFVRQGLRRLGCGTQLLDAMLRYARLGPEVPTSLSVLDLNHNAVRWYQNRSFQSVGLIEEFLGSAEAWDFRDSSNKVTFHTLQRGGSLVSAVIPRVVGGEAATQMSTERPLGWEQRGFRNSSIDGFYLMRDTADYLIRGVCRHTPSTFNSIIPTSTYWNIEGMPDNPVFAYWQYNKRRHAFCPLRDFDGTSLLARIQHGVLERDGPEHLVGVRLSCVRICPCPAGSYHI